MDIGGVFLTNGWDHVSRKKAAEYFHYDYEQVEALHNFIYNVYEIGSISLNEYLDTILFHTPRDFDKKEFIQFMYAQSTELPELLSWVKEVKKSLGVPLFALSNEGAEINEYRINTFGLHHVFDGFFSSCYVGARKPDPKIFKTALKIAHVLPEECIYFDDRIMLVEVAKKLGIHAIHHQHFEITKGIIEHFIKK